MSKKDKHMAKIRNKIEVSDRGHTHTNRQTRQKHNATGPIHLMSGSIKINKKIFNHISTVTAINIKAGQEVE